MFFVFFYLFHTSFSLRILTNLGGDDKIRLNRGIIVDEVDILDEINSLKLEIIGLKQRIKAFEIVDVACHWNNTLMSSYFTLSNDYDGFLIDAEHLGSNAYATLPTDCLMEKSGKSRASFGFYSNGLAFGGFEFGLILKSDTNDFAKLRVALHNRGPSYTPSYWEGPYGYVAGPINAGFVRAGLNFDGTNHYDADAGTVEFEVNGQKTGVTHTGIDGSADWVPAIQGYVAGNSYRVVKL